MTFREALNVSPEMPLNYENIVNALGYEDVKHCIPIGLNRLIQAAHIDPSLDIIPKITWEYPAGFSDYNTPGKYTFISSDLTNLYEKKLTVNVNTIDLQGLYQDASNYIQQDLSSYRG